MADTQTQSAVQFSILSVCREGVIEVTNIATCLVCYFRPCTSLTRLYICVVYTVTRLAIYIYMNIYLHMNIYIHIYRFPSAQQFGLV